jgi:hypothetical protein
MNSLTAIRVKSICETCTGTQWPPDGRGPEAGLSSTRPRALPYWRPRRSVMQGLLNPLTPLRRRQAEEAPWS